MAKRRVTIGGQPFRETSPHRCSIYEFGFFGSFTRSRSDGKLRYHVGMRMLAQYTVRGVPEEVDRILRETARRRKISINQLIIEKLSDATVGEKPYTDFSDLVGQWVPDAAFDEILQDVRVVNLDDWR